MKCLFFGEEKNHERHEFMMIMMMNRKVVTFDGPSFSIGYLTIRVNNDIVVIYVFFSFTFSAVQLEYE